MPKIVKYVRPGVRIIPQGEYVAGSLQAYLERHTDIEAKLTRGGSCRYFTTESPDRIEESARIFLHEKVKVEHVEL